MAALAFVAATFSSIEFVTPASQPLHDKVNPGTHTAYRSLRSRVAHRERMSAKNSTTPHSIVLPRARLGWVIQRRTVVGMWGSQVEGNDSETVASPCDRLMAISRQ